jgi:hypothetical protein
VPTTVKQLICEGVGNFRHKAVTVAQFRHDDGWARIHNEGPSDPILSLPNGEITQGHRLNCDRCSRKDYYQADRLYPVLDMALAEGHSVVRLADIAGVLR